MRKSLQIIICIKEEKEQQRIIEAPAGKTLLEIFQSQGIFLSAACAGKGVCGKCRVRFLEGAADPSGTDARFLTREEQEAGWRLACQTYPQKDCVVAVQRREEGFPVMADSAVQIGLDLFGQEEPENTREQNRAYGIAADIGTTTIAMQLAELQTGNILDTYTALNRQCGWGADVISRMEAANSGGGEALKKCIQEDLQAGMRVLAKNRLERIRRMAVSANTTMVHMLMGYSCETLGIYPFTPVNVNSIHTTGRALFGDEIDGISEMEVAICPGISAFVGGDVTAGLYSLDFVNRERPALFIDLGTNGEIVLGNRDRILAASTAAGPAFEGGTIVCGTGSSPGAVCGLRIEGGKVYPETIGNASPVGICGTGIIETLYELLREGIMDETGRMEEPWSEEGFQLSGEGNIRLYQKDIREVQLAKSALRAGIETLLVKYGIGAEEVEHVYLAGGFGYGMDFHKAVGIGLLPAEWEEKMEAVGNTSLRGAAQYLLDPQAEMGMKWLAEKTETISLSESREFQKFYMESMCFEKF